MNDDTIYRQAAIDAICEHGVDLERRGITVLAVVNHKQVTVDLLEKLPSAERRGRWIDLKCDQCGQVDMSKPNYCPNCGAKMEVEE